MDTVFLAGLVTVAGVCTVVGFLGYYTYKHIQTDEAARQHLADKELKEH